MAEEQNKAKHRILVVDDVASMRRIVGSALSNSGNYIIEEAPDGTRALEMLNNKKKFYHLVLLDIVMPKKDGLTTLKEIRDIYKFLPVVMMTAKSERADILKAASLSISGYVLKPFNTDSINKKVAAVLKNIDPAKPITEPDIEFS